MHAPSTVGESRFVLIVPGYVLCKLFLPELDSRFGRVGETTPGMAVPEASMDEDGNAAPLHDDVWPSRKGAVLNAVAHTQSAQCPPHSQLGPRVASPNGGHVRAAPGGGDRVYHDCGLLLSTAVGIFSDCPLTHCNAAANVSVSPPQTSTASGHKRRLPQRSGRNPAWANAETDISVGRRALPRCAMDCWVTRGTSLGAHRARRGRANPAYTTTRVRPT